jgi:hypothetical protein
MLPFSVEQFLDVFGRYNTDLPFAGIAGTSLALVAVAAGFVRKPVLKRIPATVLSVLWLWAGAVYHIGYFAEINTAAYFFGGLFALQAVLFLYFGISRDDFLAGFRPDASGFVGAALIGYAIAIYPLLGFGLGHQYPRSPTFGVPCPLTIFTFGVMLWNRRHTRWPLFVVPVIWTVIGSSATVLFGMWQDVGLIVAAVATLCVLSRKRPDGEFETGRIFG